MTPGFTVTLERHGGVAGIPTRARIDSTDLEEEEAARLWALLNRASDEAESGSTAPTTRLPDSFSYRLTIISGEHRREHTFAESSAGPDLRRLLELLEPHLTF